MKKHNTINAADQRVIRKLEELLDITLEPCKEIDLYKRGYTVNETSTVTGVSLHNSKIDDKQLDSVTETLASLTSLRTLYLSTNQLTDISSALAFLTSLTELNLSDNQLTDISALASLKSLTTLNLYKNQLMDISALAPLTSLTRLDLRNSQLKDISTLASLTSLTTLDLSENQLTDISALASLTNLTRLYLYNNQLTDLSALVSPTSLTRLDLGNNLLTDLSALASLTNLTTLYLDDNQLTDLSALASLTSLTTLDLHNNQLTDLSALASLTSLTELDLHDNQQLTSLPESIGRLKNLQALYLSGNPLPLPPEIEKLQYKPAELINYVLRHQKTTERKKRKEAKLILVGQTEAGKSSIADRLIDNIFIPNKDTTKGIDIRDWEVDDIKVNVWDFGGQEIMHSTHQFFLTERSLYLVVVDTRIGEDESRLGYWLKTVKSFGGDSPIIVVLNKIDQGPIHVDEKSWMEKFNIKAFVRTSCPDESVERREELINLISKELNQLEHVNQEWLPEEYAVMEWVEQIDENYFPVKDYFDACVDKGLDETSRRTLRRYLNDLGKIVSFVDDPRLSDKNILNPEWLTKGVYNLVTNPGIIENKGRFSLHDLAQILDNNDYPEEIYTYLVEIMCKFKLCFKLDPPDDRYLIAELLPKEKPDINFENEETLNFRYQYNFLPDSVISRFIVSTHSMTKETFWKTGIFLRSDKNKALVEADISERRVSISIGGPSVTRRDMLAVIRSKFDRIHESFAELEPVPEVALPGYPDEFAEFDYLIELYQDGETHYRHKGIRNKQFIIEDILKGVKDPKDIKGKTQQAINQRYSGNHMNVINIDNS